MNDKSNKAENSKLILKTISKGIILSIIIQIIHAILVILVGVFFIYGKGISYGFPITFYRNSIYLSEASYSHILLGANIMIITSIYLFYFSYKRWNHEI
jgi:hypothetical protein